MMFLGILMLLFPLAAEGAISGFVLDKSGSVLPSFAYPYTSLYLYRIGGSGSAEFQAYTNCSEGEGCVDLNGFFSFARTYLGAKLEAGVYILEVWAQEHLLERVRFEYFGESQLGPIFLDPQPVSIVLTNSPSVIPTEGGKINWSFELQNNSASPLRLDVISTLSAPAETAFWISVPLKTIRVRLKKNVTKEGRTEIPGELVDGFYVCVNIVVTEAGKPFRVLASSGFCALKGGTP